MRHTFRSQRREAVLYHETSVSSVRVSAEWSPEGNPIVTPLGRAGEGFLEVLTVLRLAE